MDAFKRSQALASELQTIADSGGFFLKARHKELADALSNEFRRLESKLWSDEAYREMEWSDKDFVRNLWQATRKPDRFARLVDGLELRAEMLEALRLRQVAEALKSFIRARSEMPSDREMVKVTVGTCGVCGRLFCMDARGRLVMHGYQISEGYGRYLGYRAGQCSGVGLRPLEVSPESLELLLRSYKAGADSATRTAERLEASAEHATDPKVRLKAGAERQMGEMLARLAERTAERLQKWEAKPLPTEMRAK